MVSQAVAGPGEASSWRINRGSGWLILVIAFYAALFTAVLPVARQSGPEVPVITSILVSVTVTAELSTSFLLFVWFRERRNWWLLLLGGAYFYSSLMAALHLLTFPGAVLPGQALIGAPQSASWTYQFWINGYSALSLSAIVLRIWAPGALVAQETIARATAGCVAAVLVAVCGTAVAAVFMADALPVLMRGPSWTITNHVMNELAIVMLMSGVLLILLFVRSEDTLFAWLGVALASMLFSTGISLTGGARYTIGWSIGRLSWAVSACAIFVFFMGRFTNQQRILAQTRNSLEIRVEERTADLKQVLNQRDVLLREVYHRVKNNLQVVDSLLAMEDRRLDDAAAKAAIARLRSRVFALGLVHQQLMSSTDLETFSIEPFLRELVDNISAGFGAADNGIGVTVTAEPVIVNLDFAIPVGLITTELLSNAIKHANASAVAVEFRRHGEGKALLAVWDDGEGGDPGGRNPDLPDGIGGTIIKGLARQLEGRIEAFFDRGTRIEIRMPMPEISG